MAQTTTTTAAPRLRVRPVTTGDVSAYKLPAGTQLSGGLTTVGVGQPLYMETQVDATIPATNIAGVIWTITTKPYGSNAALEESPLGSNVPVFDKYERQTYQIAGRKMLRPDVPGMYIVSATVTAGSSGTTQIAQTFIAGTYVGKAACTACHSGGLATVEAPTWAKTAHANLFKEGIDGIASDHYASSCISCHVVGYDANAKAVNGGFDDIAAQTGWKFPVVEKAGNFDALPDALKNLGGIQCENCHGAGSQHVLSGGNKVEISVPNSSGACAQCHDAPTHHIKQGEWVNSMHATPTTDPSGPGRGSCVGCHTGSGFVGKALGVKTLDTTYKPIDCQTCHEPHGKTSPDNTAHLVRVASVKLADSTEVTTGGTGALCMNCHQARQNASVYAATAAASAHFGPHEGPQADMLMGTNGYTYSKDIPSSAHGYVVENTCVDCHMQTVADSAPEFTHAGGHTFKPAWEGNATNAPKDLVGACQTCHGPKLKSFNFALLDYNEDGNIEGVQTEVQHLLDQLSALLPPVGKAKSTLSIDSTWTRAQLEGAYNWQFVSADGSLGIHNTAYAVGLLKASIADLKGQK